MTVDRYTKLVLTMIAVCLAWIAFGGPSMITSVKAQQQDGDNRVILAAWVDANGNVRPFPNPPPPADRFKATGALPVLIAGFTGLALRRFRSGRCEHVHDFVNAICPAPDEGTSHDNVNRREYRSVE